MQLPFPRPAPRQLQLVATGACTDCSATLTPADHQARGPAGLCRECKLVALAATARTPPRLKHRPQLMPRRS